MEEIMGYVISNDVDLVRKFSGLFDVFKKLTRYDYFLKGNSLDLILRQCISPLTRSCIFRDEVFDDYIILASDKEVFIREGRMISYR